MYERTAGARKLDGWPALAMEAQMTRTTQERQGRRRLIRTCVAVLLALVAAPWPAQAAQLALACSALGRELELCRAGAEAWAQRTGHTVKVVSTPNEAGARLALYQQLFAARGSDIDVLQIDAIWPAALAAHLVDLGPYMSREVRATHLPALIANNTVEGKLVAVPWFVDVGLLYYRKDLLERYNAQVPTTWRELTETAARIQKAERAAGQDRLWGFVFQGKAYEGLTCNALEWVASHGGGTILDESGKVTINNPRAAAALQLARSWIGDIAPPGVLNYTEEDARGAFQSRQAVFMRNWPYAWALVNAADSPVADKVGVAALPSGDATGGRRGVIGGAELAVSRYSRHPELAADLALHLASSAEQRRRALEGSFAPTIVALYDDPELAKTQPFLIEMRDAVTDAVARPASPAGARYNQVSNAFWSSVHATLAGSGQADKNLAGLATRLEGLQRRR
jgi:trehalose/maltose transport system substrate-binding protein